MRFPLVALLVLAPHTAWAQSAPSPAGPYVKQLGSRKVFGPGIVAANRRQVEFELTRPAHVIVLLVDLDGSIQPVFPTPEVTNSELGQGRQTIELSAEIAAQRRAEGPHAPPTRFTSGQQLAREGRRSRPSAAGDDPAPKVPESPYWLVILSEVPTSAAELQERLESMSLQFTSLEAELEGVARGLVVRRSKLWTAMYTPAAF